MWFALLQFLGLLEHIVCCGFYVALILVVFVYVYLNCYVLVLTDRLLLYCWFLWLCWCLVCLVGYEIF